MRLSGSITALATPFDASGELDLEGWQQLLRRQLDGGTQGVVVAGSTGEAASLLEPEFDLLVRTAVEMVGGRIPVLVGTGLSNTLKTIEQTRRAAALGADAALVVTPPYVRPTQAGLVAHYRAVASDASLPIVLYNVPGRTGCDMQPETVAELAGHPRIIGIKEAVGEAGRMTGLLVLRDERFAVLSGDDPTACRAMLQGADGVISVASNVIPAAFRHLCDLALARDPSATAWDARLVDVYGFLGSEPNPIPVKALLAGLGIGHGLRLPLTTLSPSLSSFATRVAGLVQQIETACRDDVAA